MNQPVSQLQNVFDQQRARFSFASVPSVGERIIQLRALGDALRKAEGDLVEAVNEDFGGRNSIESRSAEIAVCIGTINDTIKHLKKWAKPRRMANLGNSIPGKTYIQRQAKGIIGVISPWNYPVQLALVPTITALAAGNRVMLKPSELTPATNQVLTDILGAVFDDSQVAVITGEADVGKAFSELPFDHLFYTGSTQVGRLVAMAAASNLTPVTLELGGKSPCLMMPDASPDTHSQLVTFGKVYNAGQTCVAPDYLLVPKGQAKDYAKAVIDHANAFFNDPAQPETYTAIISEKHHQRLTSMVDEARAGGAEVIKADKVGASNPRCYPPTVVLSPDPDGTLMKEEIFGPVLPIVEYEKLDDALDYINQRDHPLALYVFGQDTKAAESVLDQTTSGGATINGTIFHVAVEHLPFGGVGKSGYGAYHGERGFAELSHERSVLVFPRWKFLTELVTPPFGKAISYFTGKLIDKRR